MVSHSSRNEVFLVSVVPVSHKRFCRHSSSLCNACVCPYRFRPVQFGLAPPPPALCIFPADSFPRRVLSFPLKLWMWPHCRAVRSPVEPISSRNSAKTHAIVDYPSDKLDTIASTWFNVHNFTFPQWPKLKSNLLLYEKLLKTSAQIEKFKCSLSIRVSNRAELRLWNSLMEYQNSFAFWRMVALERQYSFIRCEKSILQAHTSNSFPLPICVLKKS